MGSYWSLRAEVKLKPAFVPVIEKLYARESDQEPWKVVAEAFPRYLFLRIFSILDRCTFIPFGVMNDWPASWDEVVSGLYGDTWSIRCSLKNGETLNEFLDTVLIQMAENIVFAEKAFEGEILGPHVFPNYPMIMLHHDIIEAMEEEKTGATFFSCGGGCKNGGEHVWDGPDLATETSSSATCSLCGMDAMSASLWNDL